MINHRMLSKMVLNPLLLAILPKSDTNPNERDALLVPRKFICYSVEQPRLVCLVVLTILV